MSLPMPRPLEELPADLGLRAGHSRVADGNMSFSFGPREEVVANRERFFNGQNIPADRLIPFFTEHSDVITELSGYDFDGKSLSESPRLVTDVVLSDIPGAGVILGFADCVPLVVYDQRQHLITFAHVGWRSMAMGLSGKLIRHLLRQRGSRPEDLWAVIGPSIKPESYLFTDPVQASYPAWQPFLLPQADGRFGIDLFRFCLQECGSAGIKTGQIFASLRDTATDPELFSHYAATMGGQVEKQGRFYFFGWLEG